MTDVRRESQPSRQWTKPVLASAAALLLAALGIATNVATGAIPASWTWMRDGRICWPLVGILTVLCAVLAWWQTRVDVESSSVKWPLQVGMIPRLADPFQKRHALKELDRVVFTKGACVVTHVLSGLGGSGKTQLVTACARRALANHGVELLVWTTATSRDAIQVAYAEAAIKIGQSPLIDVEQASGQFLGWLQTTTRRWMVVLDDLQDPADLQGLWPDGSTGRVLVTKAIESSQTRIRE